MRTQFPEPELAHVAVARRAEIRKLQQRQHDIGPEIVIRSDEVVDRPQRAIDAADAVLVAELRHAVAQRPLVIAAATREDAVANLGCTGRFAERGRIRRAAPAVVRGATARLKQQGPAAHRARERRDIRRREPHRGGRGRRFIAAARSCRRLDAIARAAHLGVGARKISLAAESFEEIRRLVQMVGATLRLARKMPPDLEMRPRTLVWHPEPFRDVHRTSPEPERPRLEAADPRLASLPQQRGGLTDGKMPREAA